MTESTEQPKRRRRTNAEILADNIAERRLKATEKKTPGKRVRRTKEQIAADKRAEEARREKLAEERAAKIPAPVTPKWVKTIHFVNDGMTAFGKVWYRGEEITIEEDTLEFRLAFDSRGNFIFGKTEDEQIAAYGEVKYREGPWPGLPYDLTVYEDIEPTQEEIKALQKANKERKLG